MSVSDINTWFGITENASEHGGLVDHMLGFVHWFMLALFVGWSIYLVLAFTKFRQSKSPNADYHGVRGHASTHIEIGVVVVEAILLLGFAFPLWSRQADDFPTSPDTVKIRAMGEKFLWNFQYPGNDLMLSTWNPKAIAPTNVTGRDLMDPNGKDDFVNPGTMKLPVGRPIIVDVSSKDVIHNLALVPMRAAQDAIPGVKAHMWFKPVKTGTWDIICGQLCGPGHAQMKAVLEVVEDKEFDEWAKEQSATAAAKSAAQ
ncbi:cytochrome c oxidase subunit 2 [Prosthecobacter debontii]|uniref:cytochrome-c oxidase n=1 Tax=Prosthecobacter debontii TaxID=48467 RepID=A0A1T4YS41_9BACT|nr:cytochrome c oxidase subunit II [Prosthecobacter debontii]SKB04664.1 cytochrome c oxidase subunit 2 [Prosthecobacter debontii]